MTTIAFLGLGQMGSPMASNLLLKGHQLHVFDVSADAVNRLVDKGAVAAKTPGEAAAKADIVITMLPNGDIVRQALMGENGVTETLSPAALVIDMSTIHPLQTDALIDEMQQKGFAMMDAPVGRTSDNAKDGTLLILAGGTPEQVERARSVLMCMGSELVEAGGPGMGIRVKLINNYMSIALNALSGEAAVLCESLGLDLAVAINVMSGTAAGKGHFTTSWPGKVLKGDVSPAFMVDLALKDLRIAVDVAQQTGVPLGMGQVAETYYQSASNSGRGRQDWSALLLDMRQQAGLVETVNK
ncbi:sulfolactaldehyde 3-reductase [Superficieibacter sp. BNK-5]|uniref:sulfolactaldehyde 3-reductase n=1 Tax=Superficieibacter sp. BNK-5 TaxID=3376142 RepID=UPI0039BF6CA8